MAKKFYTKRHERKTYPTKLVFEISADLLDGHKLWSENSDGKCLEVAQSLSRERDIPGTLKRYSSRRNGNHKSGYCICDPFGRKERGCPLPKVYATQDSMTLVLPPKFGIEYAQDITGVKASKMKRKA